MKAAKMSFRFFNEAQFQVAFAAACRPFGSLKAITNELTMSIWAWVTAGNPRIDQPELAAEIVRLLWGADENPTVVSFQPQWVTLLTPTSGTEIIVSREKILIFFGPGGSESRFLEILDAGLRAGVEFTAVDVDGREIPLEGGSVPLLQQRAEEGLAELEARPAGYYSDPARLPGLIADARDGVRFYREERWH